MLILILARVFLSLVPLRESGMAPSPSLPGQTPGARSDPPFCRPSLFVRGCRLSCCLGLAELIFMHNATYPYCTFHLHRPVSQHWIIMRSRSALGIYYCPAPCICFIVQYSGSWVMHTLLYWKEKGSCSPTGLIIDYCITSSNYEIFLLTRPLRPCVASLKSGTCHTSLRGGGPWGPGSKIRTRHQSWLG